MKTGKPLHKIIKRSPGRSPNNMLRETCLIYSLSKLSQTYLIDLDIDTFEEIRNFPELRSFTFFDDHNLSQFYVILERQFYNNIINARIRLFKKHGD